MSFVVTEKTRKKEANRDTCVQDAESAFALYHVLRNTTQKKTFNVPFLHYFFYLHFFKLVLLSDEYF